jgi:hypothetical protein
VQALLISWWNTAIVVIIVQDRCHSMDVPIESNRIIMRELIRARRLQGRTCLVAPLLFAMCALTVRIDPGVLSFVVQRRGRPHHQPGQRHHLPPPAAPGESFVLFSSAGTQSKRPRSRVGDPSGPAAPPEEVEYPEVNLDDLDETQYDKYVPILPHQPWRRGETNGCEDPIDAPWRREAERRIRVAVETVGGTYVDVTWYLTSCVVTVGGYQDMPEDAGIPGGPATVRFTELDDIPDEDANPFIDPEDPNPEPIWGVEHRNEVVYERDANAAMERDIRNKTYARPDKEEGETYDDIGLDPEEGAVPLYVDQEFREDELLRDYLRRQLEDETEPKELNPHALPNRLNKDALWKIGNAIYEALLEEEDELQVLARHEIVLDAEGLGRCLDTQKKFDAKRGCKVAVHTQDPWQSNRVLRGILLDRNALDVYIKKQGRMVTIPNNFVKFVELVDPNDHYPDPDYVVQMKKILDYNFDSFEGEEFLYSASDEEEEEEEDVEEELELENEYDDDAEEDEDIYEESD